MDTPFERYLSRGPMARRRGEDEHVGIPQNLGGRSPAGPGNGLDPRRTVEGIGDLGQLGAVVMDEDESVEAIGSCQLAGRPDADRAHPEQDSTHGSAKVRARQLTPAARLRRRATSATQTDDGGHKRSGCKGQQGTSEGSHVGPVGIEPTFSHELTASMAPQFR
jgi:hypothetical protein